jgi:hypothetical protein
LEVAPSHELNFRMADDPPVEESGGLSDDVSRQSAGWFAESARSLNRHDQFATDICDIRTADFIELPCRCKTYPL